MQIRKAIQRASTYSGISLVPMQEAAEIKSLRERWAELQAENNRLHEENERLKSLCAEQRSEIDALEHEWDLMEAALNEMQDKLEKLEQ